MLYKSWQSAQFFGFMKRFGIDERKKIKDYSKGMRMKISIAAALSHGAELLIMDEPTSGLDPVVRDEVLDLFYNFMQDESHAILLSSHITSDLDKNRGLYHLHPIGAASCSPSRATNCLTPTACCAARPISSPRSIRRRCAPNA